MTQLLPMGQNRVRNQFFWLFSKFGSLVCLTNSRGKIHWLQNYGFCHFLKVPLLVFLDIAQNCSLGHCLTARRAETSKKKKKKKKKKDPNWAGKDLFYSNVVERPLKLACFYSYASDHHFKYRVIKNFIQDSIYLSPIPVNCNGFK